ncbi:hypothetical protein RND81_13G207200 [Saponaria officinalis]|uniref:RIN4 pathogenic type III effector avirulence factor Avr cleavage site domain-containing protein n=1 Tax=Saponaria officinalis TaxID=3572 RepID=A0AAW1H301_SAPOF
MEDLKDNNKERNAPWLSVPQFGDWDQKGPVPDYSLDFSKIREMRKQNKRDPSRASLGNEEEFVNPTAPTNKAQNEEQHFVQNPSPTPRKSFLSYFNCCVRA